MKQNVATLLIVLFAFFSVASLALLGGIVRQGQVLGTGAELAQATLSHDDKVHIVLSRVDDFGRYRKISDQIITGRTGTLRGMAGLSSIAQTNIRYFSFGLLLCLTGLLVTGLAMYLRLRSCTQQLARADRKAAI
ncbi:hypothetical protein [Lysobacter sp. P5_B9]